MSRFDPPDPDEPRDDIVEKIIDLLPEIEEEDDPILVGLLVLIGEEIEKAVRDEALQMGEYITHLKFCNKCQEQRELKCPGCGEVHKL